MAGKRSATSELNHENWDEEEEAEEAGTFKVAPQDVLKTRVIRTAKRRGAGQSSDQDRGPNVFSSFTGFAKTSSFGNTPSLSNNKSSPFSFLSQTKSDSQSDTKNGIPSSTYSSNTNDANKNTTENVKSSEYYSKLKGLNESVSLWIKTHVDSNPICILTPIFKDYEKHLKEIEELNPNVNKSTIDMTTPKENSTNQKVNEIKNSIVSSTSSTTQPTFSFGVQNQSTATAKPSETKPPAPTFNFGVQKEDEKKSTSSSLFSFQPATKSTMESEKEKNNSDLNNKTPFVTPFGNTAAFSFGNTSTPNSTGFSFGSGKPFTFANVSAPPPSENKEEDDEDEPPKVEFTPVVEEGSIYNTKCKLFVKKDNEFVERGVGQLYLKQIDGSEKTQLIIRADTNLGNLLMNIVLTKTIPTSRKGKNHVMIICVPTPEEGAKCKADQNPLQTMLIKVKNSEEADKLLEMIEKHKN